jgi:hypothetical protein
LIAGGCCYLSSAELYNPSTGTFTLTGGMKTARDLFTATRLSNGEVLVAGGQNSNFVAPWISGAELYNLATGKFSSTDRLNTARYYQTATLLPNGQLLIAGGGVHLANAELYSPSSGTSSTTGGLNTRRTDHSAARLPNGEVLAVEGMTAMGTTLGTRGSAELFHP